MNVLLKPLEENERRLILIDAILSAINIDTESEMKELIQTVVDSGVVKENLDDTDPNLVYKVFSEIREKVSSKIFRELFRICNRDPSAKDQGAVRLISIQRDRALAGSIGKRWLM